MTSSLLGEIVVRNLKSIFDNSINKVIDGSLEVANGGLEVEVWKSGLETDGSRGSQDPHFPPFLAVLGVETLIVRLSFDPSHLFIHFSCRLTSTGQMQPGPPAPAADSKR